MKGDMRSLPWPDETFDRVISWYTSFGYFEADDNRRVLAEGHGVLRPGGRLLIENNNLVALLSSWVPSEMFERNDDFAIDRSGFDPESGRGLLERVSVRDQRVKRATYSVRMFLAVELGDWLRATGFNSVEFYGPDGERPTVTSPRMVTVATRWPPGMGRRLLERRPRN